MPSHASANPAVQQFCCVSEQEKIEDNNVVYNNLIEDVHKRLLGKDEKMISVKLTFGGLCNEAVRFYSQCFDVRVLAQKSFQDAENNFPQGIEPKFQDFIFSAELEITLEDSKFYVTMGDTPAIVFTGTDRLSGCNDNNAFDIHVKEPGLIRELYQKFTEAGSKNNIPLEQSERGLRCSLIDPYGICWTMFCDNGPQAERKAGLD